MPRRRCVGAVAAPASCATPSAGGGVKESCRRPDPSGRIDTDQARELARLCALNALGVVTTDARLDDIVRILKVTGFVASATGFTAQAGVVDGASESAVTWRQWLARSSSSRGAACSATRRRCQL